MFSSKEFASSVACAILPSHFSEQRIPRVEDIDAVCASLSGKASRAAVAVAPEFVELSIEEDDDVEVDKEETAASV